MTYGPPYLIWMWEPCNWVPHMYDMICGNLVTVNHLRSPHTICGMLEHCNCQWLLWSPYTLYGRNLVTGSLHPTPKCMIWFFFRTMQCRNLVTVNDLWSPIPYTECSNLVTVNDLWSPHTLYRRNLETGSHHMFDMIFQDNAMQEPCNCQWLMVPPYLIWNVGTL